MAGTVPSVAVNATAEGLGDGPVDAVLALDIGGTKLAAGVVTRAGEVLVQERVATDRGDPWPGVERLGSVGPGAGAVASARRRWPSGVGCGGPMAPGGEHVSPAQHRRRGGGSRCAPGSPS